MLKKKSQDIQPIVKNSLKRYVEKRNFEHTPEPKGSVKSKNKTRIFVIQKHAASHLHYDFRLEMQGTLKSWAVPKGPSLNPKDKRLAVHVEDHPLEYASFEGNIPKGQYGGGAVMVWDAGTWQCENEDIRDPIDAYKKEDIVIRLNGEKLKGLWKLIKMKSIQSKDAYGKNWLLFKITDEFAKTGSDITEKEPLSVITQRTIKQIAEDEDKDKKYISKAKAKTNKTVKSTQSAKATKSTKTVKSSKSS